MSTTATQYISKIDVHYPYAGRDNDSQTFRDNFSNISQALTAVNSEINSLTQTVDSITVNNVVSLGSITNLRNFTDANISTVIISSALISGEGKFIYAYDATDMTSLDDDSSIIVAVDGRRWKNSI
jgi:hypothetical protein